MEQKRELLGPRSGGIWLGISPNPLLAKMKPTHIAPTDHMGREGTKVLYIYVLLYKQININIKNMNIYIKP